jgi:hypothetical protein
MALNTGLMAFWADFEDADISAFREWHNCQHMSERVNIPGFRLGRRYRGFGNAATFLMYYETTSPNVLAGNDYQNALNNPTEWTKRALTLFRNPVRAIFALVDEAGVQPSEPAFYLATLRFNLEGDRDGILEEYRRRVLPELAKGPDILRVRLWENQRHITGITTQESRIYGGGSGQQQYVLFVEAITRPEPFTPDNLPGLSRAGAITHKDTIPEIGWLDFALR